MPKKHPCQVDRKQWEALASSSVTSLREIDQRHQVGGVPGGFLGFPQVELQLHWLMVNNEWWMVKLVSWLVSQSVSLVVTVTVGRGGSILKLTFSHLQKTGWQVGIRGRFSFLKKGAKNGPNFSAAFVCCWFCGGIKSPSRAVKSMGDGGGASPPRKHTHRIYVFFYLHENHKFKPNVGKFYHTWILWDMFSDCFFLGTPKP